MAINLNPGADASLVAVAYKAGMATTPADYSRTLENVARGYEKTMEAQSKMWGDVAKLGASIGKEMTANAQEYASAAAKAGGLDPEGATFLIDEVYDIKDAQKDLGWSLFDDRETRQERAKLKMEQANLFADIDAAVESINVGANAVANGLYDSNLDEAEAEKVNAIIKSNLKDKNTDNGNYAKLSRDEKTGELIYTLYDSKTNELSMLNGAPQTMSIKEFSNSIANNVKDDQNVVGTNMGNIINDIATSGQTSKSGNIDQQAIQLGLNRLDNTLVTDTDWKRAMGAKYGYSNTSFIEDLTNKGEVSANLYGNLLQSMGLSEDSQVPAEGMFEGIEDTDGTLGLSLPEINAAYATYVYNIKSMKDPEASKEVFKEAFATRMGKAHEYGYGNRKITGGGGGAGKGKTGKYGGWGKPNWYTEPQDGSEPKYITWGVAEDRRNRLDNFKTVVGFHDTYTWNPELGNNGMYVRSTDDKEMEMFDVALEEGLIKTGESKNDFNPTVGKTENEEQQYSNKGLATPSMLRKVTGDNDASDKLNEKFKFSVNSETDYYFTPYSLTVGKDNVFTDDVMLIDRKTGRPVKVNGEVRRFGTGKDYNVDDLKWINDFLKNYLPKLDINTDFED